MGIFSSIGRMVFGGPATSQSQQQGTSTTERAPWAPVQPSVMKYINNLDSVYKSPQIGQYEQSGYDALQAGGASANGAADAAIGENNKTLSGAYLDPASNPYIADIAKRLGGEAMGAVNSSFGLSGRTGSGLNQTAVADGVGSAVGDLYAGNYNAERGRMGQAVGMAPSLISAKLAHPSAMIEAGKGISARPYDINAQLGGILTNLSGLGGTSTTNSSSSGSTTGRAESGGIVGNFINKLFK